MIAVQLAEEIRHEGLYPVMDARCHNLDQAKTLYRPDTPEVDSFLEYVAAIRDRIPTDVHERLASYGWYLVESNGREGEIERHVAGRLESIGTRAYADRAGTKARKLAADLRAPLRALQSYFADGGDPLAYVAHCWAIRRVVDRAPAGTLTSPQMLKELGPRKHELLLRLLATEGASS